eukprot:scaffold45832_cov54-Phaeocystis_antarctica.AAC.2
MKTSRPVDARLLADGEDSDLQSVLGGDYTRLYGGCHEHAARFDPVYRIGEGPGLRALLKAPGGPGHAQSARRTCTDLIT